MAKKKERRWAVKTKGGRFVVESYLFQQVFTEVDAVEDASLYLADMRDYASVVAGRCEKALGTTCDVVPVDYWPARCKEAK